MRFPTMRPDSKSPPPPKFVHIHPAERGRVVISVGPTSHIMRGIDPIQLAHAQPPRCYWSPWRRSFPRDSVIADPRKSCCRTVMLSPAWPLPVLRLIPSEETRVDRQLWTVPIDAIAPRLGLNVAATPVDEPVAALHIETRATA